MDNDLMVMRTTQLVKYVNNHLNMRDSRRSVGAVALISLTRRPILEPPATELLIIIVIRHYLFSGQSLVPEPAHQTQAHATGRGG